MFKSLKLSMKIALGFAALIAVASILGIIGWTSVKGMADNSARVKAGNECLNTLNTTGHLRRDFAIHGFKVQRGDNKGAAEQWQDSYKKFGSQLSHLSSLKGLKREYREKARQGESSAEEYRQAFEKQKQSRINKDKAFAEWGRIGDEVTAFFAKLDGKDVGSLRQDFVEPFLLLRVKAVYLVATDAEKQWVSFNDQIRVVKNGLEQWRIGSTKNAEASEIASTLNAYLDEYEVAGNDYWAAIEQKEHSDAQMAASAASILGAITTIQAGLEKDMHALAVQTTMVMIIMTIAAIILGILLAFIITRSIVKPINAVIESLSSGSGQVASASEQLSSSSQQMSEGASEQASSLEEISSSLEEMSSMTQQNAGNSKEANTVAGQASDAAKQGKNRMDRMSDTINRIKVSSDETAKIVKTIDEIAMQTNLLALNAAVEAARAGEAGRGFAVVAEEVRNLAQRSAEAAKNTANLIAESQKNAEEGVEANREVGEILEEIAQKVLNVDNLIAEVSAASQEQSQGIDQVNSAVAQMDTVTQQNAANAEESASASEELSGQAQQLNAMVTELTRIVQGATSVSLAGTQQTRFRSNGGASAQKKTGLGLLRMQSRKPMPAMHGSGGGRQNAASDQYGNNGSGRSSEQAPQMVIPLDDEEDLKQF